MGFSARHALTRAAWLLCLWFIVAGVRFSDLPAVLIGVGSATWTSLLLLPPREGAVSFSDLAYLTVRLLYQSVLAGIDVARRALDPQLPLNPGFIEYHVRMVEGTQRDALCTMLSLFPGTLPVGTGSNGTLVIHCLDVEQPIAQQVEVEEALLANALGEPVNDD